MGRRCRTGSIRNRGIRAGRGRLSGGVGVIQLLLDVGFEGGFLDAGFGGRLVRRAAGGFGVEEFDVLGGSPGAFGLEGEAADAHVVEDFLDDVGAGAEVDVLVGVGGVEAVDEFDAQGCGVGRFHFLVDDEFDAADDGFADLGAAGGLGFEGGGFGQVFGEEDRAADGGGDALESAGQRGQVFGGDDVDFLVEAAREGGPGVQEDLDFGLVLVGCFGHRSYKLGFQS